MSLSRGGPGLLRSCFQAISSLSSASRPAFARSYAVLSTKGQSEGGFSDTKPLYKTYKPVTPGLRHLKRPNYDHLWEGRPFLPLTVAQRKKGGRNNTGRIVVRHRGGGHKRRIRLLDFVRDTPGEFDVVRIEYDPGRSAHIALVQSRDPNVAGDKRFAYILAPEGLRAGQIVESFRQGIPDGLIPGYVDRRTTLAHDSGTETDGSSSLVLGLLRQRTLRPGNCLPIRLIPPGTVIHAVSLKPHGPARLVRAAGTFAILVVHDPSGKYAHVRLQSGEVRLIHSDCVASIGKVSNSLHQGRNLGKAGRKRWLGWRPTVRGVAMNKVDHPHGGGRGKSKSNKIPRSPWGWITKGGMRTRKPGPKGPKGSNKWVIRERPRGKEKRTARQQA
ncbi:ribosomal protein L2 [Vararia minispora EC-137]|uniref:Ribosomal protein L2 n=1 Tax=Vararia minispora EC-137 TaxID=1314806 RepID=A0ACB8QN86_9AGAM|nr:ribosomal protein L2 [Vararia minispora EC-137]